MRSPVLCAPTCVQVSNNNNNNSDYASDRRRGRRTLRIEKRVFNLYFDARGSSLGYRDCRVPVFREIFIISPKNTKIRSFDGRF